MPRPEQELAAFAKIDLAPGETRQVRLVVPRRALCFWDERRHAWTAEPGAFELRIGRSSRDIRATAAFTLEKRLDGIIAATWPHQLVMTRCVSRSISPSRGGRSAE